VVQIAHAPPTKLSDKLMLQDLPTIPKVGRKAVTPTRAAGNAIDPDVSDPIANGTFPAKYTTK
jgi:hypothetical protein